MILPYLLATIFFYVLPPHTPPPQGKMFAKKRHQEKALMKKTIAMHEEKEQKHKADDGAPQNAVPAYLLERDQVWDAAAAVYGALLLLLHTAVLMV
jgi:hypothetical protein